MLKPSVGSSIIQGFLNGVDLCWGGAGGDNLGKIAKNCVKITKMTFLGENSAGDHGRGDKPIF